MALYEGDVSTGYDLRPARRGSLVEEFRNLAKIEGVVDKFILRTGRLIDSQLTDPVLAELLSAGRKYHSLGLKLALKGMGNEQGYVIDINIPDSTKKKRGKKTITMPVVAEKVEGRLVALIGARLGTRGEVVFDGIAIVGEDATIQNAHLVGIFADSGTAFFSTGSSKNSRLRHNLHRTTPRLM